MNTKDKPGTCDEKGVPVHGGVVNDTRSSQDNANDPKVAGHAATKQSPAKDESATRRR